MRFVGDIALDAEVRAIASGAITDGAPVIVNADGTVSLAGTQSSAVGASVNLTSGGTRTGDTAIAYDSNSNRYVAAFYDHGNSQYGTAVVASVSGTTVSVGTSAVFVSASIIYIAIAFDSNTNKFLIVYRDGGNSNYGTGVVGTVDSSDNSISFGTPVVFESANSRYMGIDFDSNANKFVIAYEDNGNSGYGTAVVATISGTNVSFGTPVVFHSVNISNDPLPVTFDSSNNKVLISYRDNGNSSYGTSIVGTVSGTSISFGTDAVYASVNASTMGSVFDSSNNKIVIAYRDTANSNYGTAVVATISSTSVSFGTPVVFNSAASTDFGLAFSTQLNKTLITYQDGGTVVNGILGTVSSTSISFGSEISLSGASSGSTSSGQRIESGVAFNTTDSNFLIVSGAADGSSSGQVFAHTSEFDPLTTENFIGFAHAAYADGQKATVKTTGSIARNIPQIASASDAFGDETVFESADSTWIASTFDSNSNKVVIGYRDVGNSNYGTAIVATVSGSSISYGTPVVYNSAATSQNVLTFDSSNNKVVIAYNNGGDSGHGYAIVGTVSSTSISFGSAAEFENAAISDHSITFDSNVNRVVISFRDEGNSNYATAIVGAVSGTSISFGSPVVYESANPEEQAITFDSNSNKVVIAYRDHGNSQHGTAIVGTVDSSDNSISFGSAAVFNAAQTKVGGITFDSNSNKVVIVYSDIGNGQNGTAIVGTVSGTSISFGSESVFKDAQIEIESRTHTTFNSGINKVIITYMRISDDGAYYAGTVVTGTVSGTDITFATPVVFNAATSTYSTPIYDSSNNRTVITYRDVGNSNYGTAIVLVHAGTPEDLTIGQQYFVQTDGSLGTSADSPSVIAGTAIGASDIIVKG